MKLSSFLDSYRGLMKERTINRLTTIGLVFICIILANQVSSQKPVVVLVPQNLEGEGEVSHNSASAKIKEAWALTAANLVGNVSPGNVGFVEKALEGLLAPQLYHDLLLDIHEQALSISEGNISMSFVPSGVYFQASKNIVFIMGETTRTSRFGSPVHGRKTFEFVIEVQNYRPRITEWQRYEGGPRLNYNRDPQEETAEIAEMSDLEAVVEIGQAKANVRGLAQPIEKDHQSESEISSSIAEPTTKQNEAFEKKLQEIL